MLVNDIDSRRKLSILGKGWVVGKISLDYIGRHSCSGGILDEEDFELEEGIEKVKNNFLSFSNSMNIVLKNLDNQKENVFAFKNLKKLGILKNEINPEDLILTNSFEIIPKFCINHWGCMDEEYYLEFQDPWEGTYKEYNFKKGEIFELNKLNINIHKLDTGCEFYEWVCGIDYDGKFGEYGNIKMFKRRKILKV